MFRTRIIFLSLFLIVATCNAEKFNYNTASFSKGFNPDIMSIGGSFDLHQNLHAYAKGYNTFGAFKNWQWDLAAGVGFNGPINEFAGVYGRLLVHSYNTDESSSNQSLNTQLVVGLRAWLIPQVELKAEIGQFIAYSTSKSSNSIGAYFHSTEKLALGIDIERNPFGSSQLLFTALYDWAN